MEKPTQLELKNEDQEVRKILNKEIMKDVSTDTSGGVSTEKADQIYKKPETPEDQQESIDQLRKKAEKAIDTAQITNDTPVKEFIPAQTYELPPGTPAVFQRLPEISAQVTQLMNSINGDVKGIKKLTSFFTKGYNKDVLELAVKGATKVANSQTKMEIYKKALSEGGPDLAWEYVNRSHNENLLNIKNGKIVEKGTYGGDFVPGDK